MNNVSSEQINVTEAFTVNRILTISNKQNLIDILFSDQGRNPSPLSPVRAKLFANFLIQKLPVRIISMLKTLKHDEFNFTVQLLMVLYIVSEVKYPD